MDSKKINIYPNVFGRQKNEYYKGKARSQSIIIERYYPE